jgi:hypothetical protein
MQMAEQEASGHDFTTCKKQMAEQEVSGHDFTTCKKQMAEQEVSGHDFSRAVSASKQLSGFSP